MKTFVLYFLFLIPLSLAAQTGGNHTFALLDLGYNARATGLGGDFISVRDADVNLAVGNPSLLNKDMLHTVGFNQALMAGGINYGMATYAFGLKNEGIVNTHIRYINYGKMTRREIDGTESGTFSPTGFIAGLGYGKTLNPQISVGANLNLLYSQLETYSAFGAAIDLSGTYYNEESRLLVTALVKNFGYQFKGYVSQNHEALPAEFQMAVAHKLAHAPFRFSMLAHHLNSWDITYVDPTLKPTIDPLTSDTIPVKYAGFGEKLFHHLTFQAEILIGEHVHLRTAFDYHRREEMKLQSRPGLAGFSFGTGLYFNKFSFDYGLGIYSRAGMVHSITLTTNLDKWKK